MAVGNVGEALAAYSDSDTFLSRDAGFTWEEVHKDAHMWEFGDSGSVLNKLPACIHWYGDNHTDSQRVIQEVMLSPGRALISAKQDKGGGLLIVHHDLLGDYPKSPGYTSIFLP